MNWDALGAIGELVGAAAVVLTLGYLAIQVRQSANQSSANTGWTILNEFNRMQEVLLANPHITDLLEKLQSDEELTRNEDIRLETLANRYVTHWFQVENAYRRGLVDDVLYKNMCEDVDRMLTQYPRIRPKFISILDFYSVSRGAQIFDAIFRDERDSDSG